MTKSTKPMSNKSPELMADMEKLFPGTIQAINEKKCPVCRNPIIDFRNEISRREYLISGLCQDCQDQMFGVD